LQSGQSKQEVVALQGHFCFATRFCAFVAALALASASAEAPACVPAALSRTKLTVGVMQALKNNDV
jgi:hypothetical protein